MSSQLWYKETRWRGKGVCVCVCVTFAVRCFAIFPRQIVVFVRIPGCSSVCVFARYLSRSPLIFLSFNFHQLPSTRHYLWNNDKNSPHSLFPYHRHNIRKPTQLQHVSPAKQCKQAKHPSPASRGIGVVPYSEKSCHSQP